MKNFNIGDIVKYFWNSQYYIIVPFDYNDGLDHKERNIKIINIKTNEPYYTFENYLEHI